MTHGPQHVGLLLALMQTQQLQADADLMHALLRRRRRRKPRRMRVLVREWLNEVRRLRLFWRHVDSMAANDELMTSYVCISICSVSSAPTTQYNRREDAVGAP